MGHVDYDSTLIVGSFIAAGAICYIVISMEQLIFKQTYKRLSRLFYYSMDYYSQQRLVLSILSVCMLTIYLKQLPRTFL